MKQHTIFFDLGNVLIFFDHSKMCRQIAEFCGLGTEVVQSVMERYGDLYERGEIDSHTLHNTFCQMAKKQLDFGKLMHAVSDIFAPNSPVITIAHELKRKGHRLFLLSNTCEAHFSHLSLMFPFIRIFDGRVLSYEVRARKPEKKIYEKALAIAGCHHGKECFYTDDILPYIESARSMEIDAEQYTTPEQLIRHLHARRIL